jgi:hypothetical protein
MLDLRHEAGVFALLLRSSDKSHASSLVQCYRDIFATIRDTLFEAVPFLSHTSPVDITNSVRSIRYAASHTLLPCRRKTDQEEYYRRGK